MKNKNKSSLSLENVHKKNKADKKQKTISNDITRVKLFTDSPMILNKGERK